MSVQVGQRSNVWIETPEGQLIELDAVAVSIEREIDFYGMQRTRIYLEVIGDAIWKNSKEVVANVRKERQASEWQCEYCGRPNHREDELCKSCGSVRPFIYRD